MPTFNEIMEEFSKSGEFRPEHMNVGRTLRSEESDKFIDLVVTKCDFLQKITVEKCSKLEKDINVWEFIQEVLQRVPEGKDPEKYTGFGNVGKKLRLMDGTLFSFIPFSFYEDNARNPRLEGMIEGRLAGVYSLDLLRMGFVGVKDDYSAGFKTLNTGWIEKVKTATGSKKLNSADYEVSSGVVDWSALISATVRELDDIYKSSAVLVMNPTDHEEYAEQIGNRATAHPILFSGKSLTPLGYDIERVPHMPRGHLLFTPLKNLVFGHGRDIQRFRELSGVKRCVNYTVTSYFDYEVAVDAAAVIAWKK